VLQAFSFCLKYNRKTEFRKLCDKLRKHLEDISKLPAQTANVSIQKPETQQLNLDTRLVQLDSAIQMELWQVCRQLVKLCSVSFLCSRRNTQGPLGGYFSLKKPKLFT
jgi:hypothetical protein